MPPNSRVAIFSTKCDLSLRSLGLRDCRSLVHRWHDHLCSLLEEFVQYVGRGELLGHSWCFNGLHLRVDDRGPLDHSPPQLSVH